LLFKAKIYSFTYMENVEFKQIAHINDDGRPLCSNDSEYLHLCEPDKFERLPQECRCQRCEQLFRHCLNTPTNKQYLLTELSRRTSDQDSWSAVTDLRKSKTKAKLTSLSRTLWQLEIEGLVEMKTNGNDSFVRLSNKAKSNSYLIEVYLVDC
jgi:hypothetical protein